MSTFGSISWGQLPSLFVASRSVSDTVVFFVFFLNVGVGKKSIDLLISRDDNLYMRLRWICLDNRYIILVDFSFLLLDRLFLDQALFFPLLLIGLEVNLAFLCCYFRQVSSLHFCSLIL